MILFVVAIVVCTIIIYYLLAVSVSYPLPELARNTRASLTSQLSPTRRSYNASILPHVGLLLFSQSRVPNPLPPLSSNQPCATVYASSQPCLRPPAPASPHSHLVTEVEADYLLPFPCCQPSALSPPLRSCKHVLVTCSDWGPSLQVVTFVFLHNYGVLCHDALFSTAQSFICRWVDHTYELDAHD